VWDVDQENWHAACQGGRSWSHNLVTAIVQNSLSVKTLRHAKMKILKCIH